MIFDGEPRTRSVRKPHRRSREPLQRREGPGAGRSVSRLHECRSDRFSNPPRSDERAARYGGWTSVAGRLGTPLQRAAENPRPRAPVRLAAVLAAVVGILAFLTAPSARAQGATISSLAITSDPGSDDTYVAGDKIEVTVTFSEAVTVTGTPRLTLLVGSRLWILLGRAARDADFERRPEPAKLVFAYAVAAGDGDPDGVSIAADSIALNGGTIVDGDGAAGSLPHAAVAAQSDHLVDTTAPTVLEIFVDGGTLTIDYSEALDASSVPAAGRYQVEVGGNARSVSEVGVSGTAVTLTLAAAVLPGETVQVSYGAPSTGGVRDAVGNAAAGFALAAHEVVNETRPTVSVATADDAVHEGTEVDFELTRNGPATDSLTVDVEVVDGGNFLDSETRVQTLAATFEAGHSTA